ncbi:hypothetical protein [Kaistella palustris]|uniref:hypothetical protein n=1 Tax=Kaistella palustris TaxID=493376 RepID=UPI0003F97E62|nr:hypothetical protein [Kaistella palustris]
MKKFTQALGAVLILLLVFVSCSTREDDQLANEPFVGTWNWVSTDGGIANTHDTPESTGITRTMTFTADNHFKVMENNVTVNEGTYQITRQVTNTDHVERTFINFSDYPDLMVKSVDASDLFLAEDANDGFSYHYSK